MAGLAASPHNFFFFCSFSFFLFFLKNWKGKEKKRIEHKIFVNLFFIIGPLVKFSAQLLVFEVFQKFKLFEIKMEFAIRGVRVEFY